MAFLNKQILSNPTVFIFSQCYTTHHFHSSVVFNAALCVLDTPAKLFRKEQKIGHHQGNLSSPLTTLFMIY